MFNAPIPGESLTRPPKSFPWERPPEMTDPEEVMMFYLDKIMNPDTMGSIMDSLEVGMTIKDLVDGILRTGVSEGLHTIDVSLLVAPAIHEAIKSTADQIGIQYDEGLEDKKAKAKAKKEAEYLKSKVRLGKFKAVTPEEKPAMEEPVMQEEAPMKRGLMARGM